MFSRHSFTPINNIILFFTLSACVAQVICVSGSGSLSTLEEKIRFLQDTITKKPAVQLNLDRWKNLVRSSPRNYSMVVMFTALAPNMNCAICKPVYDEFLILANSYRYAYLNAKALYFAIVDYEEAPQIFTQLNLNTAPAIYHFPAKGSYRPKQDLMDFQRQGIDADAIAKFVMERTQIQIRVLRPPNYTAPVMVALFLMLVVGLLYLRRNNLEFIYNRTFWGILSLGIVFVFLSGQMWNHIRGPPFMMTHPQTRETAFIHGSSQYQFIAETYIIFALYAGITAGVVLLNDTAAAPLQISSPSNSNKNSITDPTKKKVFTVLGLALIVVLFSLLLSIFRSKYRGYPYHFLFS